ncbi:hypothetical protein LTR74_018635 [Friedmanniomyces endolithicus]|nr:hypothetical protein LTR74_018635 [Friedmanniomyces endolithicus]
MARPASSLAKDAFRKRKCTTMKKALELSKRCNAHVYVVLKYHGRFHAYTSEKSRLWPPTVGQIETSYPPADDYGASGALTDAANSDAAYRHNADNRAASEDVGVGDANTSTLKPT